MLLNECFESSKPISFFNNKKTQLLWIDLLQSSNRPFQWLTLLYVNQTQFQVNFLLLRYSIKRELSFLFGLLKTVNGIILLKRNSFLNQHLQIHHSRALAAGQVLEHEQAGQRGRDILHPGPHLHDPLAPVSPRRLHPWPLSFVQREVRSLLQPYTSRWHIASGWLRIRLKSYFSLLQGKPLMWSLWARDKLIALANDNNSQQVSYGNLKCKQYPWNLIILAVDNKIKKTICTIARQL